MSWRADWQIVDWIDPSEPRFWNSYLPPASYVAAAIQFPMTDAAWPDRVIAGYARDCGNARRARPSKVEE